MYILRAGMTGCLAAIKFPGAIILDEDSEPKFEHKALLRMRTKNLSIMTGIPFRKVEVKKFVFDFEEWDCNCSNFPEYCCYPTRHDGPLGGRPGQQSSTRRCPAPVVRNLENLDRRDPGRQGCFCHGFDVTGEEHAAPAVTQPHHYRPVVL